MPASSNSSRYRESVCCSNHGACFRGARALQCDLRLPPPQSREEADGKADVTAKVHDLRPAGDRPAGRQAYVLQEAVVPEVIALVPLAQELVQAAERVRHEIEDGGREL